LQEETAWKAEIGWDGKWSPREGILREVALSATLSAAWAQNLIVLVPNSQNSFIAQNIGRSEIFTPEISLATQWVRGWSFRGHVAALSTQNLSDVAAYFGKALPMRPASRAGLEWEWQQAGWCVTYSLQATGSFYADPANTRLMGAYWEHGIWASWKSAEWGTWLVELRNLTDALVLSGQEWNFSLNHNTTGLAGFPAPGRRVYFTWQYEF
jgi:outer membrane cobalamin receptor